MIPEIQTNQCSRFKPIQSQPLQIITNDTQPFITPAVSASLTSQPSATNRNKIMIRTSNKSIFKRRTSAEAIKDNILKCRYNRRVGQLKELTQHNVQMFLRIKAQDSHYKFKTIQPQVCSKIFPIKSSRIQSQSRSTHTNSQTQLVKDELKTRCFSLKRGFAKEFNSINNVAIADDDPVNVCKSTENVLSKKYRIQRKVQRLNNKENQVENHLANLKIEKLSRESQFSEVQNKLVAKKLGLLIPSKDLANLKEKNIFRRKQEHQAKRFTNNPISKNENAEKSLKQKKKSEGLAEIFLDRNRLQQ